MFSLIIFVASVLISWSAASPSSRKQDDETLFEFPAPSGIHLRRFWQRRDPNPVRNWERSCYSFNSKGAGHLHLSQWFVVHAATRVCVKQRWRWVEVGRCFSYKWSQFLRLGASGTVPRAATVFGKQLRTCSPKPKLLQPWLQLRLICKHSWVWTSAIWVGRRVTWLCPSMISQPPDFTPANIQFPSPSTTKQIIGYGSFRFLFIEAI